MSESQPTIRLDENSKLEDISKYYEIGEELGSGAFSIVKQAFKKDNDQPVAIKIIHRNHTIASHIETLRKEINCLRKVSGCSKVIKLLDIFEDPDSMFLVFDLMEGGTLLEKIVAKGHYSEKDTSQIIESIIQGIACCHSRGLVHRDIKPENLLCATKDYSNLSDLVITDFGLAAILGPNEFSTEIVGTREYVAPEMILRHPYRFSVDMWSIGCIAYVLLGGYHPFTTLTDSPPLFTQIVTGSWEFHEEDWCDIGDVAKDFVSQLLVLEPENRMTAREALMHPFIKKRHDPKTVSPQPLQKCIPRLGLFAARQKLQAASLAIIATNKMKLSNLKALDQIRSKQNFASISESSVENSPSTPSKVNRKKSLPENESPYKKVSAKEHMQTTKEEYAIHKKALKAKRDDIKAHKYFLLCVHNVKSSIEEGSQLVSNQEDKIKELVDAYRSFKDSNEEQAKNVEASIHDELHKLSSLVIEEEEKLISQLDITDRILGNYRQRYEELVDIVSVGSNILEMKANKVKDLEVEFEDLKNALLLKNRPQLEVKFYPYEELLKNKGYIDHSNIQDYLEDEEFKRVFKMDKQSFLKMPKWKQLRLKKEKHLVQDNEPT